MADNYFICITIPKSLRQFFYVNVFHFVYCNVQGSSVCNSLPELQNGAQSE